MKYVVIDIKLVVCKQTKMIVIDSVLFSVGVADLWACFKMKKKHEDNFLKKGAASDSDILSWFKAGWWKVLT